MKVGENNMSNFIKLTKHPKTKKWELAMWIDGYFGNRNYGVKFSDKTIIDIKKTSLIIISVNDKQIINKIREMNPSKTTKDLSLINDNTETRQLAIDNLYADSKNSLDKIKKKRIKEEEIEKMTKSHTYKDVGEKYGITKQRVGQIVARIKWRNEVDNKFFKLIPNRLVAILKQEGLTSEAKIRREFFILHTYKQLGDTYITLIGQALDIFNRF